MHLDSTQLGPAYTLKLLVEPTRIPVLRPSTVRVTGEDPIRLEWDWLTPIDAPARSALAPFLGLRGKGADAVGRFIQVWGPIGFCEHGRPSTHDLCTDYVLDEWNAPGRRRKDGSILSHGSDRFDDVQRTIERFSYALEVVEALQNDALDVLESWDELPLPEFGLPDRMDRTGEVAPRRAWEGWLTLCGNSFLIDAGLRPSFEIADERSLVSLGPPEFGKWFSGPRGLLFTLLAVEFLQVAGGGAIYRCDVCNGLVPKTRDARRPRRDRAILCGSPTCRAANKSKHQRKWRRNAKARSHSA